MIDSDPSAQRPLSARFMHALRRMFLSGVLITVPIIVTYVVLNFLFENVDGILSPLVERAFGYSVPGMGLVATFLIILLIGILGRNVVGSRFVTAGEAMINRMPVARTIYGAAKQLVEAVTHPDHDRFKHAVLIEYPRKGLYQIGFASGKTSLQAGATEEELVAIFIPSTPTPVTGFVVLVPRGDVIELSMSAEEAIKFLVSGGLVAPSTLTSADKNFVEA
jgi:uncharacterized membrane protein